MAPARFPLAIGRERELGYTAIAADLDGDGADEVVFRFVPSQPPPAMMQAVMIQRASGQIIDQFNFMGVITAPTVVDADGDGRLEVVVPGVRNDSLFLHVIDPAGKLRHAFFATSGAPRIEQGNVLPWLPTIHAPLAGDFDRDGRRELALLIATGYARSPRGLFLFELPGGRLIGRALTGASIVQGVYHDFDRDGAPELLATGWATNNGAAANGLDDSGAYLVQFDVSPVPAVRRFRRLPVPGVVVADTIADLTGDSVPEILFAAAAHAAPGAGGLAEIFDARSWTTVRRRAMPGPIAAPVVTHLDRDPRPEILAIEGTDVLLVLDQDLEVVRRRRFGVPLQRIDALPDADRDGVPETVVQTTSRSALLRPDLRVKVVDSGAVLRGVVRQGPGLRPLLLAERVTRAFTLRSLAPNPSYLVHRYGPGAAAAAGLALGAALLVVLIRLWMEARVLRAVTGNEGAGPPALLVSSRERIRWIGAAGSGWLGVSGLRRPPRSLGELAAGAPEVAAALRERLRHAGRGNGGPDPLQRLGAAAQPVVVGVPGDPHWLVVRQDGGAPPRALADRAWALMAQRVAHSIKNPLTSIRLSLQRMQMEYRDRMPAAAAPLDRYVERVEEQIDDLRRLTSNFLKFADLEDPHFAACDLNRLVNGFVERAARGLPPDIRLELALARDLPPIRADRDQLLYVLDNLVANAVNAMREGGRITIATDLARAVQWEATQLPRDHVQLEVLDTGAGVDPGLRDRLFEPGVTGHPGGSGLGLAIVRKIVADHGGRITWESEVGVGSAFTVHLPVTAQTEAPVAPAGSAGRLAEQP